MKLVFVSVLPISLSALFVPVGLSFPGASWGETRRKQHPPDFRCHEKSLCPVQGKRRRAAQAGGRFKDALESVFLPAPWGGGSRERACVQPRACMATCCPRGWQGQADAGRRGSARRPSPLVLSAKNAKAS